VTHTKRIYRNLLRKETSFVYYTSSVLRKSRHMQKSTAFSKQLRVLWSDPVQWRSLVCARTTHGAMTSQM